jgi:hypothetical protein
MASGHRGLPERVLGDETAARDTEKFSACPRRRPVPLRRRPE